MSSNTREMPQSCTYETNTGSLTLFYFLLGIRQLFGDVTKGKSHHNLHVLQGTNSLSYLSITFNRDTAQPLYKGQPRQWPY